MIFRHTTLAQGRERRRLLRFRHPLLASILTQVIFWTVGNTLLTLFVYWMTWGLVQARPGMVPMPFHIELMVSLSLGVVYGTVLGVVDVWLQRWEDPRSRLGIRIALKALFYTLAFLVLLVLLALAFLPLMRDYMVPDADPRGGLMTLCGYALYAVLGNILIAFIRELDRTLGPGMLRPLLLGSYRQPQEERRIFMFMDLKGSTTHAESLGHLRYSAMIRELFLDVNRIVPRYEAEIYQYIGDEVILTWDLHERARPQRALLLYYAVMDTIAARADIYRERYGMVPAFKAGVHAGVVTAVEIGILKREIAYHGDTVNTTARIQGMSNALDRSLLVSDEMLRHCGDLSAEGFRSEAMGELALRGRMAPITVHAIERKYEA